MNLIVAFMSLPVIRMEISQIDQFLAVIAGFVFKPLYMFLSMVLILITRKNKSQPITLMRYGLISFLLGESFCAVNYLISSGVIEPLEILHGAGMVGLNVFLPWGIFALIDEWVLHFSDEFSPCTLLKLCGPCWKYAAAPCKLKQLFWFAAPALAIISLMPLCAPLKPYHCIMPIYSTPTHFQFSSLLMGIEFRLYPVLGCVFMLGSLLFLGGDSASLKKSQIPFFLGIGFMSFSMFRFILVYGYSDVPQWFNFWEELTELMIILGLCLFFFLYRKTFDLVKKRQ